MRFVSLLLSVVLLTCPGISCATADLDGTWGWEYNGNPAGSSMVLSLSTTGNDVTGAGVSYGVGPFSRVDSIKVTGRGVPAHGLYGAFDLTLNFASGLIVTYSCQLVGTNELEGTWASDSSPSYTTVIFNRA